MRFQMPETMKDKTGSYPDTISVAGSSFEVDQKTGVFDAPDLVEDSLKHMNIRGAVTPKKAAPAPEPVKPTTGGENTRAAEVDALVDPLTYEQLAEELTKMGIAVRNKKSERAEDLKAALLAPKE